MSENKRQFLSVRFRVRGQQYTYHHDGVPVAAGDKVKVDGRDGWQVVTVDSVTDVRPSFETKPIMGLAEPEPAPPIEEVMTANLFGVAD